MKKHEGYIMTPVGGGIDTSVIYPGSQERFKGLSGRMLYPTITDEKIDIRGRYKNYRSKFKAVIDHDGIVYLDIQTKTPQEERHPDLYATGLTEFTLDYFTRQGHELTGMQGTWEEPLPGEISDNYEYYIEQIASGVDSVTAANNTWTGKLARRLGFTQTEEPLYLVRPKKTISVLFSNPAVLGATKGTTNQT